ncbi:MAG: BamA/TamA family outer membrane protein [Bdellovibrionota bacterium]
MLSRARLLLGCCLILLSSCAALSSEDQSHTNEVMPPSLTRSKPERAAPSKAAEASLKQNDVVQAAVDMAPVLQDGRFHSLAPLAGYDPTYGAFAGAGYFGKRIANHHEVVNWGLAGILAEKHGATQLEYKGNARLGNFWRLEWRNEFANGFESNYGSGNETLDTDRIDVPLWRDEADLYFPYYASDRFAIGPGIEGRFRRDRPMVLYDYVREKDPLADQEATIGIGLLQRLDFRDVPENPSIGWEEELHVVQVEPFQGPYSHAFTSLDLQISTFEYLLSRDLVLANSLSSGLVYGGTPTFLNQFRIGGSHKLRGFYHNRFRGSKYYVEQNELRFPIFRIVSGTAFLEFGEATNTDFTRPHRGYGGGLLIGIPPDNVSKIRIDYALSIDQKGITVDFGHAF